MARAQSQAISTTNNHTTSEPRHDAVGTDTKRPTPRTTFDEAAISAFVERTTRDSGVPSLVDDIAALEQIARVLA